MAISHLVLVFVMMFLSELGMLQDPTSKLVLHYKLDDNTRDSSDYKNHGDLVEGTSSFTTDRKNRKNSAFHFQGTLGQSTYIRSESTRSLPTGNVPFSLAIWLRPKCGSGSTSSSNGEAVAISFGHATKDQGPQISMGFKNNVAGTNWFFSVCGSNYNIDAVKECEWVHCAVVYQGKDVIKYYTNGKYSKTLTTPSKLTNGQCPGLEFNENRVQLGRNTWSDALPFWGDVDDFQFYSISLNESIITKIMHGGTLYKSNLTQGEGGDSSKSSDESQDLPKLGDMWVGILCGIYFLSILFGLFVTFGCVLLSIVGVVVKYATCPGKDIGEPLQVDWFKANVDQGEKPGLLQDFDTRALGVWMTRKFHMNLRFVVCRSVEIPVRLVSQIIGLAVSLISVFFQSHFGLDAIVLFHSQLSAFVLVCSPLEDTLLLGEPCCFYKPVMAVSRFVSKGLTYALVILINVILYWGGEDLDSTSLTTLQILRTIVVFFQGQGLVFLIVDTFVRVFIRFPVKTPGKDANYGLGDYLAMILNAPLCCIFWPLCPVICILMILTLGTSFDPSVMSVATLILGVFGTWLGLSLGGMFYFFFLGNVICGGKVKYITFKSYEGCTSTCTGLFMLSMISALSWYGLWYRYEPIQWIVTMILGFSMLILFFFCVVMVFYPWGMGGPGFMKETLGFCTMLPKEEIEDLPPVCMGWSRRVMKLLDFDDLQTKVGPSNNNDKELKKNVTM